MNKIKTTLAGLLIACIGLGTAHAQATTGGTATTPGATPAKKPKGKPINHQTAAAASPTTAQKPKPTSATSGNSASAEHLKKDGTLDRRYKENKTTTAPASSAKKTTTGVGVKPRTGAGNGTPGTGTGGTKNTGSAPPSKPGM